MKKRSFDKRKAATKDRHVNKVSTAADGAQEANMCPRIYYKRLLNFKLIKQQIKQMINKEQIAKAPGYMGQHMRQIISVRQGEKQQTTNHTETVEVAHEGRYDNTENLT